MRVDPVPGLEASSSKSEVAVAGKVSRDLRRVEEDLGDSLIS